MAQLGGLWLVQRTGLVPVLAAWVGAKVLVGIGLLAVLWRAGRLVAPGFGALRAELPFIATIGLTNLIGLLNYRVGLFIIERLLGLSATGVYSIAVVVAELLWFVSSSLTQAVYGRIGTPDRAQAAAITVRVVQLSVAALLLAAPLSWALASWLVPALLGPDYSASLPLMAWLLPGVLMFGGVLCRQRAGAGCAVRAPRRHAADGCVAACAAALARPAGASIAVWTDRRLATDA